VVFVYHCFFTANTDYYEILKSKKHMINVTSETVKLTGGSVWLSLVRTATSSSSGSHSVGSSNFLLQTLFFIVFRYKKIPFIFVKIIFIIAITKFN